MSCVRVGVGTTRNLFFITVLMSGILVVCVCVFCASGADEVCAPLANDQFNLGT